MGLSTRQRIERLEGHLPTVKQTIALVQSLTKEVAERYEAIEESIQKLINASNEQDNAVTGIDKRLKALEKKHGQK